MLKVLHYKLHMLLHHPLRKEKNSIVTFLQNYHFDFTPLFLVFADMMMELGCQAEDQSFVIGVLEKKKMYPHHEHQGDEEDVDHHHHNWADMELGVFESSTSESSSLQDSRNSVASSSSCSSDLADDASSTSSSSTLMLPSDASGPLYELSDLMAQLPIRRGLSKFYQGKSQSYTSLASVKSIEDLAKKGVSCTYRHRMKSCKSYAAGLDGQNHNNKLYSPKATIRKKGASPRTSFLSSLGCT